MNAPDTSDRLSFTIFLAAALHALLIFGVTFTIAKGEKIAPTLNITLASHKSVRAPDKADFLAQHNQEGSGTEKKVLELTSDQESPVADVDIHEVTPIPAVRASTPNEHKTAVVTTTAASQQQLKNPKDVNIDPQEKKAQQGADEEAELRSEKYASLQAKLDKLRQAMAREPRITRHTSVSAKAADEAEYYNHWSEKILRVGNQNFPQEALKKGIFGSLRLSVRIRADGSVAGIELLESSGHKVLDEAAIRIVRQAAPFEPFPPEIRKNTDIFEIIRTWEFQITGLSTR